jgi:hypothetical protein
VISRAPDTGLLTGLVKTVFQWRHVRGLPPIPQFVLVALSPRSSGGGIINQMEPITSAVALVSSYPTLVCDAYQGAGVFNVTFLLLHHIKHFIFFRIVA